MSLSVTLVDVVRLLQQLGKVHPAPGSEARVMEMYRSWLREREAGPGEDWQGSQGERQGRSRHPQPKRVSNQPGVWAAPGRRNRERPSQF